MQFYCHSWQKHVSLVLFDTAIAYNLDSHRYMLRLVRRFLAFSWEEQEESLMLSLIPSHTIDTRWHKVALQRGPYFVLAKRVIEPYTSMSVIEFFAAWHINPYKCMHWDFVIFNWRTMENDVNLWQYMQKFTLVLLLARNNDLSFVAVFAQPNCQCCNCSPHWFIISICVPKTSCLKSNELGILFVWYEHGILSETTAIYNLSIICS